MTKTESFVAKAREVHGDRYAYDEAVYVRPSLKVKIKCEVHGEFEQSPDNHLKTGGCKWCGVAKRGAALRIDTEEFIKRAERVHGNMYTYSETIYKDSKTHVKITCPFHGVFSQSPNNHLIGHGCAVCGENAVGIANRVSLEDLITAAKVVHGDKYTYTGIECRNGKSTANIVCPVHGEFSQATRHHLSGSGCLDCAESGYRFGRTGSFYILTCGDLVKVGITNNCPTDRAKRVSRSSGKNFQVAHSWTFSDGKIASDLEVTSLTYLKAQYSQPHDKFHGYTECFLNVNTCDLLEQVKNQIQAMH